MRINKLALPLLASSLLAQTAPYEHHVKLPEGATKEQIIEKAAQIVPNTPQRLHHQDEFVGFIHFGPNTFTGVEWGNGKEDPAVFNPGDTLDTDQWCRIMKAAGMRKVVITIKHHDGFCTWQTRYNNTFSVSAIPWRDGKGDVLRELSDSCRKHGLKLGVYISPADLYQIENEEHGLYGNLSEYQTSIIPTDPESFHSDPTKVRADKAKNAPTFTVEADDYNRLFMNQLYEALTEYGPIHEVWFDGAHPKRKGGQKYIKEEWFKMIRALAPEAAIFGGPDVRWCGNESGVTRESEWSVLPIQDFSVIGIDRSQYDVASGKMVTAPSYKVYGKEYASNYLAYLVNEVDTSIRHGWFWRNDNEQDVRTADDTFDIYERTIGGNSVFLLNIPPNKKGLFSPRDEALMLEVGRRIRETYTINLAANATVNDNKINSIRNLFDGNLDTYWSAHSKTDGLRIKLPQVQKINRFMLQESITKVGQRIKAHELDAWIDGDWKHIATGTTVGYKKILRFPAVETNRFRLRILDARLEPSVAEIGAFYYNAPAPAIHMEQHEDKLILSTARPNHVFSWKHKKSRKEIPNDADDATIHYTLDGSEPTMNSPRYTTPIGNAIGILKARSFKDGQAGPLFTKLLELSKENWSIVSCSSEQAEQWSAAKAIDTDPNTFWHTSWDSGLPHPHEITIDLDQTETIGGITYLPRQDRHIPDGMIERGKVMISIDKTNWQFVTEFSFGNILNDPTKRKLLFDAPQRARYLRIISKAGAQGKPYAGAAEIGVLPSTLR